jgi:hypothetical protein
MATTLALSPLAELRAITVARFPRTLTCPTLIVGSRTEPSATRIADGQEIPLLVRWATSEGFRICSHRVLYCLSAVAWARC